jgi:CrcB protein
MLPVVTALAVGMAGAFGALARYMLAEEVAARWKHAFPLATLIINIVGACALAFLFAASARLFAAHAELALQTQLRAVVGAGFLGGFTTFSTLSAETHTLFRRKHHALAWLNVIVSLLLGALAVVAGLALGNSI